MAQTLTVHGPIVSDGGFRPTLVELTGYDSIRHNVDSDQRLYVQCRRGGETVRRLEYAAGSWSSVDVDGVPTTESPQ